LRNDLKTVLLATTCALLVVIPPLFVYFTYPNTGGYETGLEEALMDLPVKPPPFLIGSMNIGLHRGRSPIVRPEIEKVGRAIYAYWQERRQRVLLILQPRYIDEESGRIISANDIASLIMNNNATLVVEVFETHRGFVGIVIEVHLGNQTYYAIRG